MRSSRSTVSALTALADSYDIINYANNRKFPNNNNQSLSAISKKGRLKSPFKLMMRKVYLEDLQDN